MLYSFQLLKTPNGDIKNIFDPTITKHGLKENLFQIGFTSRFRLSSIHQE